MATMTFQLPLGLSPDDAAELERACLAGGPDSMPAPTALDMDDTSLKLTRDEDDSCFLVAPWSIPSAGRFAVASTTLMSREQPYDLLIEITRGKVNQVRNQAHDWVNGGLVISETLNARIRQLSVDFVRAVSSDREEAHRRARVVLQTAYEVANDLVALYREEMFRLRQQRQPLLNTALTGRLDESVLRKDMADAFTASFTRGLLPLSWHTAEREESFYDWTRTDLLMDWAESHEIECTIGPLVTFAAGALPQWLWAWERDVLSMASFMCRYVEKAVRRYRSRIRRWHLTTGSNWSSVLGLSEEELLGLTYRMGEAALSVDPDLELVVGLTQPWGEYRIPYERPSPFQFADTLFRSGLRWASLNLEIVMGVNGRGSYVRDGLDLSRLLDLYSLLGIPLTITMGYPASTEADPLADSDLSLGAGHWRDGYSAEAQADWVRTVTSLALCKNYVREIQWCHFSDQRPHQFPNCGLIGRDGSRRPALDELQKLREMGMK